MIRNLSSSIEWSGSSNRIAFSSPNTSFASSKDKPCFFLLISFLFSSHVNFIAFIIILYLFFNYYSILFLISRNSIAMNGNDYFENISTTEDGTLFYVYFEPEVKGVKSKK